MFGLTEHIGSRIYRICRLISDNQNLTRPGKHINITMSVDFFFGKRNKDIARTCYLVDAWNGLRTESHSCYRLRSANLVDFVDAGKFGSNQNIRINFAGSGR